MKFDTKLRRGSGKWRRATSAVDISDVWGRDDMADDVVCHFVATNADMGRAEYWRLKPGEFGSKKKVPSECAYWLVSGNGALAMVLIPDESIDNLFKDDEDSGDDGEIDLAKAEPDGEA